MYYPSPPELATEFRSSRLLEVARDATPMVSHRIQAEGASGRKPRMAVGNREQMKKYLADSYTRCEEISILPGQGQRDNFRIGNYGNPAYNLYGMQKEGNTSTSNFQNIDMCIQCPKIREHQSILNTQPQQLSMEFGERKAQLARRAAQEHYKAELDLQIAQQHFLKQQEKDREQKVYLPATKQSGPIPIFAKDRDVPNQGRQHEEYSDISETPYLPSWFKPVVSNDSSTHSSSLPLMISPDAIIGQVETKSQNFDGTVLSIDVSQPNAKDQVNSISQFQDWPTTQPIPVPVQENSIIRFPGSSPIMQLSPTGSSISGDGPNKVAVESLIHSISPNEYAKRRHVSQTADQRPPTVYRKQNYNNELQQQIEQRRRLEQDRKYKERLEEDIRERKLQEDQERMQREYQEEILRVKKKEEETLKRQEEILKNDTVIKKKLEEEKRKRMAAKLHPQHSDENKHLEKIAETESCLTKNEPIHLSPEPASVVRCTRSPPIVSQYSLYLANHREQVELEESNVYPLQQIEQPTSKPILTKYTMHIQMDSKIEIRDVEETCSSLSAMTLKNLSDTDNSEKRDVPSEHKTQRKQKLRKRVVKTKQPQPRSKPSLGKNEDRDMEETCPELSSMKLKNLSDSDTSEKKDFLSEFKIQAKRKLRKRNVKPKPSLSFADRDKMFDKMRRALEIELTRSRIELSIYKEQNSSASD